MKISKIKLPLLPYSLIASAITISNSVSASNCVDSILNVDPDGVCSYSNNGFDVDLNSDGQVDFRFNFWKPYYSYATVYGYKSDGVYNPSNKIVGGSYRLYTNMGNAYIDKPYAAALDSGDVVDYSANFLTGSSFFRVAYFQDGQATPASSSFWIEPNRKGKKDKYFGVQFEISGNIHYGWINASILSKTEGGSSITFHEYGYNTEPNQPVKICSTPAGVSELGEESTIYSFENKIMIENGGGNIEIYNSIGQLQYSGLTTRGNNIIEIKNSKGLHIIRFNGGSKKLFLN
ncbi:MAG: T9SS type A sorting domain-containing protein [Flavobacteriales bacterium]|nr:T9SS type A sorting domain-containing protein [Flavobacteriales bacterium]